MIGKFFLTIFTLIFGTVKFIFTLVSKLLAKVITMFNLSLPFLYILFGLIFHLIFGILKKDNVFFMPFHLGLIIVFGISIIITIKKALSPFKSKEKTDKEQDFLQNIPDYYSKPHVFRVKENPQYIVYEFYDKYQVFKETKAGLEYIRTDYKQN